MTLQSVYLLLSIPLWENCLWQKVIFPCLHSESRHQKIQLTQGLDVCMGIFKQLSYKWINRAKGKGYNDIHSKQRKPLTASKKDLFVTTGSNLLPCNLNLKCFYALEIFPGSNTFTQNTSLRSNSNTFHLCPQCWMGFTDIHEKCDTLKRHQTFTFTGLVKIGWT